MLVPNLNGQKLQPLEHGLNMKIYQSKKCSLHGPGSVKVSFLLEIF